MILLLSCAFLTNPTHFKSLFPDSLSVHPDFFGEIVERKKTNRIAQKKAQATKKAIKN